MTNSLKYFHYTHLKNSVPNQIKPDAFGSPHEIGTKKIKIQIRSKLIYIVEIMYYSELALLKFHPKIYEDHDDKYKVVGMGLTHGEKRQLLNTCCKIVHKELERNNNFAFGFFGQCYDRDDSKNRSFSKRFDWYVKQVTLFFSTENYNHELVKEINFYCISKIENSAFESKKLVETLERENWSEKFMTAKTRKEYLAAKGLVEI